MSNTYKNNVIVITGGSSGLGKALAQRFLAQGAHVALIARDLTKLGQIKGELVQHRLLQSGQMLEVYSCDVSDYAACGKTMAAIAEQLGAPNILINSAGILKEGYFDTLPLEDFRSVMDINYFGIIHCIRAVLPYYNHRGHGRIVNVASLAGKFGNFGHTAYSASKHALVGLTESLRMELTPRHIMVQLVCPPEFDTPMVANIEASRTPENRITTLTIPALSLDQVADEVFTGIKSKQYLIIPGRVTRFMERLNRLAPAVIRKVVDGKIKKAYVGPKL